MYADDHGGNRDEKQRLVGYAPDRQRMGLFVKFVGDQCDSRTPAHEEHQGTQPSEKVHRAFAEFRHEHDRYQIQVPFDHAFPAELRHPVLACAVLDDLLPDLPETGAFGQQRNKPVHFAVNFDAFDHFIAVGFQAAVEVVQADTRSGASTEVEEFARQGFAQRIVALLFPTAHQVVALERDHAVELRNFVGRVLQVCVHRDDHVPPCGFESAIERGRFAVIAAETDSPDVRIVAPQRTDDVPRIVTAAVVDENHLERVAACFHHTPDPCEQFGKRLLLVVQRDYYGDVGISRCHGKWNYQDLNRTGPVPAWVQELPAAV